MKEMRLRGRLYKRGRHWLQVVKGSQAGHEVVCACCHCVNGARCRRNQRHSILRPGQRAETVETDPVM